MTIFYELNTKWLLISTTAAKIKRNAVQNPLLISQNDQLQSPFITEWAIHDTKRIIAL